MRIGQSPVLTGHTPEMSGHMKLRARHTSDMTCQSPELIGHTPDLTCHTPVLIGHTSEMGGHMLRQVDHQIFKDEGTKIRRWHARFDLRNSA